MNCSISGNPPKDAAYTNLLVQHTLAGGTMNVRSVDAFSVITKNFNSKSLNTLPIVSFKSLEFVDSRFTDAQNPAIFVFGAQNVYMNIYTGGSVSVSSTETGFDTIGNTGMWTYTGESSRIFQISGSVSMETVNAGFSIGMSLFINDALVPNTEQGYLSGSIFTPGSGQLSVNVVTTLDPGDRIEFRVRNISSDANGFLHSSQMSAFSVN